jgi:hypothetical protein
MEEEMDKAAAAILALLACAQRIQSEQPTRKLISPESVVECKRIACVLQRAALGAVKEVAS